ncbi:MAG TPA: RagB/SusD family nutrient uptake outer membrane protein, partial [Flavisolibacter sp.]|nr:RagB/SusD family nutrient uptake outer membrane protein [Flavisolibacter sp.]
MRTNIFRVVTLLFLMSTLASCKKDFLDIVPKGRRVAQTTEDYNLLMNANTLYFYNGNSGWQLPVVMGDELNAEAQFFNTVPAQFQRAFRWEAEIYERNNSTYDLTPFLQNLYVCNKVINEVQESEGGTDQQKAVLRAEAQATRAWLYFQFINFYAKPYRTPDAASDPGFPIIREADIAQKTYTRSSVQEVYDFIITDLMAAIPNLPVKVTIRTRMSQPAAQGLLGKVYLFMGRSAEAIPHLAAALQSINTASGQARLFNYNVELAAGGSFLPISPVTGPAGPGNNFDNLTESVVSKVFYNGSFNGSYGNAGLVLDPSTVALYGTNDLRLKFYAALTPNGTANPSGRLRKNSVQYSRMGLELADLYLISAECKARTNDLGGSKADLETLRRARMPAADAVVPAPIAGDQEALIKFIVDERIREFAMEGYRWFDMRRLSLDPIFSGRVH